MNKYTLIYILKLTALLFIVSACDTTITESLPDDEDADSENVEDPLLDPIITEEFDGELEWSYFGLEEIDVNHLQVFKTYLFALSEDGLFRRDLTDPGSVWVLIGFETDTIEVKNIAILDEDHWLIRVHHHDIDYDEVDYEDFPFLYRTRNGGIDWEPEASSNIHNTLRMFDLYQDQKRPEILWSIRGLLVRSDDFGKSWYTVDSAPLLFSGNIIATSQYHKGVIWVMGTGIIQALYEYSSYDDGESWQRIGTPFSLLHDVVFNSSDIESCLVITATYTVHKSTDRTQSWSELISPEVDGVELHSAANSITEGEKVYAGGRLLSDEMIKDEYRVLFNEERDSGSSFLLISNDWGESWEVSFNRDLTDIVIRQVVLFDNDGEDVIFLRTSGGIYKVRSID